MGSETHYARAFSWRNYEYSKKPFAFSNDEAGFATFTEWMDAIIPGMEQTAITGCNLHNSEDRDSLFKHLTAQESKVA